MRLDIDVRFLDPLSITLRTTHLSLSGGLIKNVTSAFPRVQEVSLTDPRQMR
jgi:hypothetical protein